MLKAVGPKSTVGTATEVTEHLRLLMSQIGKVICPDCRTRVTRSDPQSIAQSVNELPEGTRYQIVFHANSESGLATALMDAKRNGFVRAVVGSVSVDLSDTESTQLGDAKEDDPIRVVVDRLKTGASDVSRVRESIEIAFQFGRGRCEILLPDDSEKAVGQSVESSLGTQVARADVF